jgi:Leucine-rich repeat (LRR) protein
MAKCLVTTLSEAATDSNLLKLGELMLSCHSTTVSNLTIMTSNGNDTITLRGDAYFTDSTGTQNYGKIKTGSGNMEFYISPGDCDIIVGDKHRTIVIESNTSTDSIGFDLSDVAFMDKIKHIIFYECKNITGNLQDIANTTSLERFCVGGSSVKGNVASLENLTSLVFLYLNNTNVEGTLSSFANMDNLTNLRVDNTAITGDTSDLANLTNLNFFIYTNTAITGKWPLT